VVAVDEPVKLPPLTEGLLCLTKLVQILRVRNASGRPSEAGESQALVMWVATTDEEDNRTIQAVRQA
jgi:hypothetical protein